VTTQEQYQRLGMVSAAMAQSPLYCQYPVACIRFWIEPAILLNQIKFFFDVSGNLAGYMTWAFLAEDTEHRLIHDSDVLLHISEWNEGNRLWILDMVVLNGDGKLFANQARKLFPKFSEARSLRRRDDGSVRRVVLWKL